MCTHGPPADRVPGREYWLGESEGFRVRAPGRRLGVVERLVRDEAGTVPAPVVLGGVLGFRRWIVERDAIADVVARERTVVLARRPAPRRRAAGATRRTQRARRLAHG